MSGLMGDIWVGLAVLVSVIYAAATLGPKSWRARAFAGLAAYVSRIPAGLGSRAAVRRFADRLSAASNSAGGCGGCGSCGSAAPTASSTGGAAGEVRVPVAKIGRRAE